MIATFDLPTMNWLSFATLAVNLTCIIVLMLATRKTHRARDIYIQLAREMDVGMARLAEARANLEAAQARLDKVTKEWEQFVAEQRATFDSAAAARLFTDRPLPGSAPDPGA